MADGCETRRDRARLQSPCRGIDIDQRTKPSSPARNKPGELFIGRISDALEAFQIKEDGKVAAETRATCRIWFSGRLPGRVADTVLESLFSGAWRTEIRVRHDGLNRSDKVVQISGGPYRLLCFIE